MSKIDRVFPRWAASWGVLAQSNALVRSQCQSCGIQHRVDASIQSFRFGGGASPVDQLETCNVVGCHGSAYFLVARTYGREWIAMLSRDDLRASAASSAPAANAVSLDLIQARTVGAGRRR